MPLLLIFGVLGTFGIAVAETRKQCVTSEPLYDVLHKGELYKHVSADQTIPGVVFFIIVLVLIHPQRSLIFRRVRPTQDYLKELTYSRYYFSTCLLHLFVEYLLR